MNQNTFGKTKAANDLVRILENEDVEKKTIKKISKKLTNYNRGLNAIVQINDEKIKAQLLEIWKDVNLEDVSNINVSKDIIDHLKNIELAYLNRKAYNKYKDTAA